MIPINAIKRLFKRSPDAPRVVEFTRYLPRIKVDRSTPQQTVLVQCVEDAYFMGIFACCIASLSEHTTLRVGLVVTRSIEGSMGSGARAALRRTFAYSGWLAQQWVRIYQDLLGARTVYRSVSWRHPVHDACAWLRAKRIVARLDDSRSLEALHVDGVHVGDLVIDTYLRFRPAASIDIRDRFLRYLVWQALRDMYRANRYFRTHRPLLYLSSFSTYIQHGVPVRVALAHDVPVVTFGNLQQVGKRLSTDDPYHTKNPLNYREIFESQPDKGEAIAAARAKLEQRLSGGRDAATAYMATSAYVSGVDAAVPDVKGAVVVFLHDFFDSPHVYADMIFEDFWSWICFTIETLQACGHRFLLKPHPNQVSDSQQVVRRLREQYPNAKFIEARVSNRDLVAGGMAAAVTAYGTVAHELAYLGVPSICCARHPHVAFDFCATARDREHYGRLLARALELKFGDPAAMREQVLQFYVSHNMDGAHDELLARDALVVFWQSCQDPASSAETMGRDLRFFAEQPGLRHRLERLLVEQKVRRGCK